MKWIETASGKLINTDYVSCILIDEEHRIVAYMDSGEYYLSDLLDLDDAKRELERIHNLLD